MLTEAPTVFTSIEFIARHVSRSKGAASVYSRYGTAWQPYLPRYGTVTSQCHIAADMSLWYKRTHGSRAINHIQHGFACRRAGYGIVWHHRKLWSRVSRASYEALQYISMHCVPAVTVSLLALLHELGLTTTSKYLLARSHSPTTFKHFTSMYFMRIANSVTKLWL